MERDPKHPDHGEVPWRAPATSRRGEESNAAHLESNHGLRWVKGMEGGEAEGMARSGGR
jgi:hypothetical protein